MAIVIVALIVLPGLVYTINSFNDNNLKERVLNTKLQTIKPQWKGNLMIDGEFVNDDKKDIQINPIDILKWKAFSVNPQKEEKKLDTFSLELVQGNDWVTSDEDMIVWLGHASFFIRLGGVTFVTDPVFYDMFFIKRHVGIPCPAEDIKGIDYLLLSHGHRDHFDKKTIEKLVSTNPKMEALVPLKNGEYFKSNNVEVQEAGWYQQYITKNNVEVYFMPARHWNRRALLDFNKTLWGSFIIKYKNIVIYFAGDTSTGDHFAEIAEFFPKVDYALLPVGAYKPEFIMKEAHMSPQEGYNAFKIMGAKTFIPMHFGTYDLADEPLGEPYRVLSGLNDDNVKILKVGEVLNL